MTYKTKQFWICLSPTFSSSQSAYRMYICWGCATYAKTVLLVLLLGPLMLQLQLGLSDAPLLHLDLLEFSSNIHLIKILITFC